MQLLAGYEQSNYDHLWHCTSWQTRAWSTVIEILCIHSFIFSKEKKKNLATFVAWRFSVCSRGGQPPMRFLNMKEYKSHRM